LCFGSVKKPKFSSNRADRILAACLYHEIPATLVLNKIDLDKKGLADEIEETYRAAGVDVLQTSVETGAGVDAVAELLRGKTTALYGASGVGKSSMLNKIEPSLELKVGHVSSHWAQGRHTTTHSSIHPIPALDAWIVDTPGIRVFRLHDVNTAELRDLFPEFAPFAERCHFPDCTHTHEPECAVLDAVEAEELSVNRFASYLELHDESDPPPDYVPEVEPDVDP
jgi:ribosome biogenesis GTPase